MSKVEIVDIARVGAQGDGVIDAAQAQRFVPFTLTGERVEAAFDGARGRLLQILDVSAERVPPVCRHFGVCGGCALQHLAHASYLVWKREQVIAAFRARGIEADVAPVRDAGGKRRRAVLTCRRTEDGLTLGFHTAQSHDVIGILECPVLEPRIVAALPALQKLIEPLISKRGEARVTVTATEAGLDVAIDETARTLTPDLLARLARDATTAGFARVSIGNDPLFEALQPFLTFGTAEVIIPPGVFIQAVAEAERTMVDLVVASLGKVKSVADLFAGVGAFTFPIAAKAKVLAVDSDKRAVAALKRAVNTATGVKPIAPLVRDLFREPLSPLELNEHDAIVFDPPRAGAEAQVRAIARARVKTVVAVSCNPATLARDARILIDGGYTMSTVTPVDQFVYTPHIEVVTVFRR